MSFVERALSLNTVFLSSSRIVVSLTYGRRAVLAELDVKSSMEFGRIPFPIGGMADTWFGCKLGIATYFVVERIGPQWTSSVLVQAFVSNLSAGIR